MANIELTHTNLTTSIQTAHTVNAAKVAQSVRLHFCNYSASARAVTVWYLPTGVTPATDAQRVLHTIGSSVIPSGGMLEFHHESYLQPGDKIQWAADVSSNVAASGAVREIDQVTNDHKQIAPITLTTSGADLYTVTTGYEASVFDWLLCNYSGSSVGVDLWVKPGAAATADVHKRLDQQLLIPSGKTINLREVATFVSPGSVIRAVASANSAVNFYAGLHQEVIV